MKKILLVIPLVVVVLAVAGAVLQARHRAELSAKAGVLYQKIQQDRVLEA